MRGLLPLCLAASIAAQASVAATLDINFGSYSSFQKYFDPAHSTGLWNFELGWAQGGLAPGGVAGKEIDFGDGTDGFFSDGPAQTGITLGNPIVFDTDVKSVYNFAGFSLSPGVTILVVGSRPLVIKVLGSPSVVGTIVADGGNGASNSVAPTVKPGGTAVAGGGSGGNSGAWSAGGVGMAASAGGATAPAVGGGIGINASGGAATTNDEGGGGGCNGTDGTANATGGKKNNVVQANQAVCASTQAAIAAAFESAFTGGAGGGGGGALVDDVLPKDVDSVTGSGGGAGGGAIRIATLGFFDLQGTISVNGGNGGSYNTINAAAADCGGGGGGGSGGSIWLQSGDALSGGGTLSVSGGTGGTSPACGNAYNGGNGSRGVIRTDTIDGTNSLSAVSPDSTHPVTFPSNQTYVVTSKPIDFSDRYYSFSQPVETVAGCINAVAPMDADSSLTIVYEGSRDAVSFEHPVSGANIAELNSYPFIRFKATIATGTAANPPCLTALSIPYTESDVHEFRLKGGLFCGRIKFPGGDDTPGGGGPTAIIGDLALMISAFLLARRRAGSTLPAGR